VSKKLSRREMLLLLGTGAAGALLARCGKAPTPETIIQTVEVEKVVERTVEVETVVEKLVEVETVVEKLVEAEGIIPWKYPGLDNPFGGEKVTLSFWDWHRPRIDMLERWFKKYTEAHPNVTFEITLVPGEDIATKLMAAIPAGAAPDFHYYHNDWGPETWVWGGLLSPFPNDMFPTGPMTESFSALGTWLGPQGQIYWIPTGYMSAALYYNKDIFAEEGLTEDDLPTTWDELIELGKRLTTYDAAGRVERSGFNTNDYEENYQYLYHQQGYFRWNEGYERACYHNEPTIKALQWIRDVNHEHKLCDDDFLNWFDAFGSGKAAMVLAWTWYTNWLNVNIPEANFGVSRIPTWDGSFEPTIGWGSCDPQSPVVPSTTANDRKATCFDVIGSLYSDPEFLIDNALTLSSPPGTLQIADNPLVQRDPTIQAVAEQSGWILTGLAGPPLAYEAHTRMTDAIFKVGDPIEDALQTLQMEIDQMTDEYIEESGDEVRERWNEHKYAHADMMKYPEVMS